MACWTGAGGIGVDRRDQAGLGAVNRGEPRAQVALDKADGGAQQLCGLLHAGDEPSRRESGC